MSSPTFWTRRGERQAIENRIIRECRLDLLQVNGWLIARYRQLTSGLLVNRPQSAQAS